MWSNLFLFFPLFFRLMLHTEIVSATLKELIKKAEGTDKKLGLKDVSAEALRRIASGPFPQQHVLQALILGLQSKKPRLSETCLTCCHHLLMVKAIYPTTIFDQISSKSPLTLFAGKPVITGLTEALIETFAGIESSVSLKALDCLSLIVLDLRFELTGTVLLHVLQSCFNISLTSTNIAVQINASGVLRNTIIERVVRHFVKSAKPATTPTFFACQTMLDFTQDYEPTDPYIAINTEKVSFSADADGPLASHEHDLLLVIRTLCMIASKAVSGSAVSHEAIEVRSKIGALKLLVLLFTELPYTNSEAESFAASSLSILAPQMRGDLWRCIGRNVVAIIPGALFDASIELLGLVVAKCHYHLSRDIHFFLSTVVFPLAQSKFSNFQQKLSVLTFVRSLLSRPETVISLFVNYDCDPAFDEHGKYGDFLESLVNFTMEMMYLNFVSSDWFSEDQQAVLRSHCVRIMHDFSLALRRWIFDDPKSSEKHREMFETTELHLDQLSHYNFDSDGESVEGGVVERKSGGSTDLERHFQLKGTLRLPYHWKHVHQMFCNKKILKLAVMNFNKNWKHGRKYLVDKGVIGDGDTLSFAWWLRRSPCIERNQLSSIFENILKDKESDEVLVAYMRTFDYKEVPIDIALKTTALEFVSLDKPQYEAQVWGRIQSVFGEAYAKQNNSITSRDADALAGVILFLHSSLHNPNAKNDRMTKEEFIVIGGSCLQVQPPHEVMAGIYDRVAAAKWGSLSNEPLSVALPSEEAPSVLSNDERSRVDLVTGVSEAEEKLLDGNMKTYAENIENFKKRQQNQLEYMRVANYHLRLFEKELAGDRTLQRNPYIVPYFAQHVRLIILTFYPQMIACAYLGLRTLRHDPILRLINEFFDNIHEVASAFLVNITDMFPTVEKTVQRCLRQERAVVLGPLGVTITTFLMQRI